MSALAHAYAPPPDDDSSPRSGLSVLEHLEEFRTRLVRSCIAVAVGVVICFFFIDLISIGIAWVAAPHR